MQRRAANYRRPARNNLSCWIWALLGIISIAGFFLFVMHHQYHGEDQIEHPILGRDSKNVQVIHEQGLISTLENASGGKKARQLIEQMTLAKAYLIIAKEHNNLHLSWQLSSKIRSCQFLLSKAAMRDAPISLDEAEQIIRSLSSLIFKAQDAHYDIATTMVTMKSHIQALEQRANAASVQREVFALLSAEWISRHMHCLDIKLTTDWVKKEPPRDLAGEIINPLRLADNNLYHFFLFSDNLLAVSVAINSTVSNADHPQQFIFHIVTDRVNYGTTQAWFLSNDFKGSTIEVQKVEDFTWLNASYSPVVKDNMNSEAYLWSSKLLDHLPFYVPEIYPQLEKVVYLDDDVVVQKDLTSLFLLDLHGNVNGAVETCLEAFRRFYKYFNFSNPLISSKFDPQACGWAFGVNVFDLIAWRKENVTARYHYWQEQNCDRSIWKLGTLPPALLAFYGLIEPLDRRWHVLGLGYDLNIDNRLIESAAVIHFNGNLKPSNTYIQDCVTTTH